MFKFNSKEDKFFVKFQEQTKITLDGANVLKDFLSNLDNPTFYVESLQKLEHNGDDIVHTILDELNNSFVTPIDRDDIYLMTKKLDDVIDAIESVLHRFVMFNIEKSTDEAKLFVDFLVSAISELVVLFDNLSNLTKSSAQKVINQKIIEINRIENDSDLLYKKTIGTLFRADNIDPLEVVKWKDVYQKFEDAIDSCENLANIIRGVVVKHA